MKSGFLLNRADDSRLWPLEVGVLANEINKKPMQYARLLRLAWRHRPWRQTILFLSFSPIVPNNPMSWVPQRLGT
jgi:hypothetical protein